MINLIVKKNNLEVLRLEITDLIMNEKELTLSIKEQKFQEIGLIINSAYMITVENDTEVLAIPERIAMYRSYMYSVGDRTSTRELEDGTVETYVEPYIAANQLLFTTL